MQPVNQIRNPDTLYNQAIAVLGNLLQAISQDEEPDREEMMVIKFTIQILSKEKIEQHTRFQQNIQQHMNPGMTPWEGEAYGR